MCRPRGRVVMGRKLEEGNKPKKRPRVSLFYNEQWVPFETVPAEVQQQVRQRITEIWTAATVQQLNLMAERTIRASQ